MAGNVLDTFNDEVQQRHSEMISDLESISVDNLRSEGVTLSFGGKTFKFSDLVITNDSETEERIRTEFKDKLNTQQQRIREKINSKINQLLLMHQTKTQELDRKERELREKYSKAALMPDMNERHVLSGLSVIKGRNNGELIWLFNCFYNPKFIIYYDDSRTKHRKIIPSRLASRMKKPIIINIKTKSESILSVTTRTPTLSDGSLKYFPHYHQTGTSDCWGKWKHPQQWKTPDDIIRCAKDALAVLETINHGSIANRTPTGLPKLTTLVSAVEKIDDADKMSVNTNTESSNDEDVWESI